MIPTRIIVYPIHDRRFILLTAIFVDAERGESGDGERSPFHKSEISGYLVLDQSRKNLAAKGLLATQCATLV